MKIEVSNGEILDKLSILEIKCNKILDTSKNLLVLKEYNYLKDISSKINFNNNLYSELLKINNNLWEIEDKIREKEYKQEFDEEFINLARRVYFTNDKRSQIKLQINQSTNSDFIEIKSYKNYKL
jgi:hypothetical protein